ncbi:hypothetical protein Terro_2975 [Terriglobus roseus DSM 18391]|uniref:Uncharacterized protein n=1 Tax=Terriglobus roseus (strain DSM 18391 / NRRL B-41598 / KBS 63) TaxID=926566 RepID=I3ZIY9_TERRK|nr:hypothetical protein [Terriglobus roseus]AFL89207.1 hypothetical protein Terro_2975 [Terriglobus roseus DSM 18391]
MPNPIQVGANEFRYAEVRTGTRCIKIWTTGKTAQCYKFNPDPHLDGAYNKDQAGFYRDAAVAIASIFNSKGSFPRFGKATIEVYGKVYLLEEGSCS